MLYRNVGAPWRRPDGSIVARGAIIEPTEDELERRRYKLRPYGEVRTEPPPVVVQPRREPAPAEPVEVSEPTPPVSAGETALRGPRWHMIMKPELYLKLHPNGPHADLAREVLGVGDAAHD